jgi:hypothetical protein
VASGETTPATGETTAPVAIGHAPPAPPCATYPSPPGAPISHSPPTSYGGLRQVRQLPATFFWCFSSSLPHTPLLSLFFIPPKKYPGPVAPVASFRNSFRTSGLCVRQVDRITCRTCRTCRTPPQPIATGGVAPFGHVGAALFGHLMASEVAPFLFWPSHGQSPPLLMAKRFLWP